MHRYFGIFSDEGQVEGDFNTEREAEDTLATHYDNEDGLYVAPCCHDHPEFEEDNCEACDEEDEDEDAEEY